MPSTYYCQFPKCSFQTSERDRIDRHHIIPRSMENSSNKGNNLIWLCPDHHRAIFVPGVVAGHHAIQNEDSIILVSRFASTQGEALEYQECSTGKSYYYFFKTREVWEK